jgi:hypothetical protein
MLRSLFLILVLLSSAALSLIPKPATSIPKSVQPIPNPTTLLAFDTVYKTNQGKLQKAVEKFHAELTKLSKYHGYIINYGTNKEIARREKIIRTVMTSRKIDSSRITVVRVEMTDESKSVFYMVPSSVEPPVLK